ncbi:hypothetical protein BYT27DRAFT_7218085 [Phlegmacium glaucopus]|nr:hypothetical protein BYT27DRAFT_7218085 [Phlegmacium glaucopus]
MGGVLLKGVVVGTVAVVVAVEGMGGKKKKDRSYDVTPLWFVRLLLFSIWELLVNTCLILLRWCNGLPQTTEMVQWATTVYDNYQIQLAMVEELLMQCALVRNYVYIYFPLMDPEDQGTIQGLLHRMFEYDNEQGENFSPHKVARDKMLQGQQIDEVQS